jgi:uncharacterized protein YcaQ
MPEVAVELVDELRVMAGWLGLDRVVVAPRGDLAGALARATRTSQGPSRNPSRPAA